MSEAAHLEREAEFFDRWAGESIQALEPIDPRIVARYRQPRWLYPKEYCIGLLGDLRGKQILDVGCGEGEDAVLFAKLGATVMGYDVSPRAIEVAKKRAEIDGVADRVSFVCAPLSQALLPWAKFDVIWFDNILHHVLHDFEETMKVLLRSGKVGAQIVCIEPVNLNRTLRKIRFLVPVHTEVTPGERPLEKQDLAILSRLISGMTKRHFNFLGRLTRFVIPNYRYEKASWWRRVLADALHLFDRLFLSFPVLEEFGGIAILSGVNP
jgi:SAM-dependent methyltransferase